MNVGALSTTVVCAPCVDGLGSGAQERRGVVPVLRAPCVRVCACHARVCEAKRWKSDGVERVRQGGGLADALAYACAYVYMYT